MSFAPHSELHLNMLDLLLNNARFLSTLSTRRIHAHAGLRYSLPYKDSEEPVIPITNPQPLQETDGAVVERVAKEGPCAPVTLMTSSSSAGWWDWKPAKKALEQLFMQGDLMVSAREGFQKTYDLTERVLPTEIDTSTPGTEELATHLIDQQLRCHGLVSLKGMTYLRRDAGLRKVAKELIQQRVSAGKLDEVLMPDNSIFFSPAGHLEQPARASRR